MKQQLQVLSSEVKEGVGKKSGSPYKMTICQCVLTDTETGEIRVGELTLPKDMEAPAGLYDAEFKIGVDYQTKKIGGVLIALHPVAKPEASKPAIPPLGSAKQTATA